MYSTYDRKLTAIFESVKYFRHFLEGQNFSEFTDHWPLTYALSQNSSKGSPCQQRQRTYIAQFTSNVQYQPGTDNVVADSLSRVEKIRLPTEWSLIELAEAQKDDQQLRDLINNPDTSINLKKIQWGPDHTTVYCDLTGAALRPYIPKLLRKRVFDLFHEPAHPSKKVTDRFIRKRYVWLFMQKDIAQWCKACVNG